jgi:hypothetical protein
VDRNTNRMNWGAALDYERGQPDASFHLAGYQRSGANGNFQYLFDRNTSVGGSLSVYQTRTTGAATTRRDPWHRRQRLAQPLRQRLLPDAFLRPAAQPLQPDGAPQRTDRAGRQGATGQELQWEQDWIGGRYETMRPELTTTLGYAHDQSGGVTRTYPTAGVQFRYWLDTGFHVSGNLRYTSQGGSLYTSRGLSGSLTAEKELAPGWRLGFGQFQPGARGPAADLFFRSQRLSQ